MPARSRSSGTGLPGTQMPTISPGRTRGGTLVNWLTDWLIGFASDRNCPLGLATLLASAMIEYVVPPVPGDTITLLGAILITGYGWSWWAIFGSVVAGSLLGSLVDYWVGLRLRARPRRPE